MENKNQYKCKDCKYYNKPALKIARSGNCMCEAKKVGDIYPLMGCNTKACDNFKRA